MKKMTFPQISAEVQGLDPNLSSDSEAFHCAALMLSALQIGTDEMKLARFTGYKLEWIQEVGGRLQNAGIWKDGKTHANWAYDMLEFWLAVCVAEGTIERTQG